MSVLLLSLLFLRSFSTRYRSRSTQTTHGILPGHFTQTHLSKASMLLCPAPSTQKGFARHFVGVARKSSWPCQNGTTSSLSPESSFCRDQIPSVEINTLHVQIHADDEGGVLSSYSDPFAVKWGKANQHLKVRNTLSSLCGLRQGGQAGRTFNRDRTEAA